MDLTVGSPSDSLDPFGPVTPVNITHHRVENFVPLAAYWYCWSLFSCVILGTKEFSPSFPVTALL